LAEESRLHDIGACVFDAYGTLFDVNAAAARCRDVLGDKADALASIWRTKQLEYTWLRSLRGDYVDFWHVTGQSLDYAMAALQLEDDALRTRLMELYLVLDAYPEVREMLSTIKGAGVRTAILSNGSPTMLVAAVRRAELEDLLDEVISVDSVRIYKPHPRVYQLAVDRLRLPSKAYAFSRPTPGMPRAPLISVSAWSGSTASGSIPSNCPVCRKRKSMIWRLCLACSDCERPSVSTTIPAIENAFVA
jgi:2-haloacid dehalogenase